MNPQEVKHAFEPMEIQEIGKIKNVVNKSGAFNDNSQNFASKGPDNGGGNGGPLNP